MKFKNLITAVNFKCGNDNVTMEITEDRDFIVTIGGKTKIVKAEKFKEILKSMGMYFPDDDEEGDDI